MPYALWAVFAAAYATLSLQRFSRFDTPSWDNAIFTQAIAGYANLGAPVVDIKGPGFNILGDHFSPIIALVAPFYRIFPDPRTLLVAQAVAVGFSVVPIARLAIRRLGLGSGLAVAMAYGLSFGIASAVYVDFHEVAFAAPLLALAGEAYVDRRWGPRGVVGGPAAAGEGGPRPDRRRGRRCGGGERRQEDRVACSWWEAWRASRWCCWC
ncbi:MAG: DUF2079 domain-containing protein [Nocardioidaceae bacterium]